jgi:hypothetical protein
VREVRRLVTNLQAVDDLVEELARLHLLDSLLRYDELEQLAAEGVGWEGWEG